MFQPLHFRACYNVAKLNYLHDGGAGQLDDKPVQDQGYVEQGQAAVHEDHLVDEGGAELVADFAEEGDVDESEESGAYHGGYLQVKPLSSGVLGHLKQTTATKRPLQPLYLWLREDTNGNRPGRYSTTIIDNLCSISVQR